MVGPLLNVLGRFEQQPYGLHDGQVAVEAVNLVGEAKSALDTYHVLGFWELGDAPQHVVAGLHHCLFQVVSQILQLLPTEAELLLIKGDAGP